MARARQPSHEGPPGLGGKLSEEALFERAHDSHAAIGEADQPSEPREIPWSGRGEPENRVGYAEQGITESLEQMRAEVLEEAERLNTLWNRVADQNAVVEQTSSQLRMIEQTVTQGMALLEQCKNAIITLEQRLNALAQQQVQTNTRMAALQLAVQGKASHDSAEKVVAQAERFYQFLLRDLVLKIEPPPPPPQQEEQKEQEVLPDGTTQH